MPTLLALDRVLARHAPLIATLNAVGTEKLAPNVLLGKQLFYDARDTRLARDRYMSCASCHNDGGHDGRVWDLTGFGEGLRNTINLVAIVVPGATATTIGIDNATQWVAIAVIGGVSLVGLARLGRARTPRSMSRRTADRNTSGRRRSQRCTGRPKPDLG